MRTQLKLTQDQARVVYTALCDYAYNSEAKRRGMPTKDVEARSRFYANEQCALQLARDLCKP